jgi:DNA replication protein DnaC
METTHSDDSDDSDDVATTEGTDEESAPAQEAADAPFGGAPKALRGGRGVLVGDLGLVELIANMRAKQEARKAGGCEVTAGGTRCGRPIVDDGEARVSKVYDMKLPVDGMFALGGSPWWLGLHLCEECTGTALAQLTELQRNRIKRHLERNDQRLPYGFRWARPGAPELITRIQPAAAKAARIALEAMIAGEAAVTTLAGEAGTGKTSLAVLMLRNLAKRALECELDDGLVQLACGARYVSAWDLSGEGEEKLKAEAVYQDVANAPLLVIDDLGAERHGVEVVFKDLASKLISTRFQRGSKPPLPTIVTTGLTPEAAERLYGGGVARRIFNDDGGQVRVVQFATKRPKQATRAA